MFVSVSCPCYPDAVGHVRHVGSGSAEHNGRVCKRKARKVNESVAEGGNRCELTSASVTFDVDDSVSRVTEVGEKMPVMVIAWRKKADRWPKGIGLNCRPTGGLESRKC